jgi:hypothetical protein
MTDETKTAEVLTPEVMPQESALATIIKSEIDVQIATAKAFPRSLKIFMDKVLSMATITETVAQSCTYALPRAGKTLKGPSVRLAEIVGATYCNLRYGARVIFNDGKHVTAQGICHDLEANTFASVEVKRSILQNEYKNGNRTGRMVPMSEDMQVVTGNAACSIAMRNAIFKVVPAALIEDVYEKIQDVARGTAETLVVRRDKAIKFFTDKGIKREQIAQVLNLQKVEDIDLDDLATLTGMKTAFVNNESSLEELFPPTEDPKIKANRAATAVVDKLNKTGNGAKDTATAMGGQLGDQPPQA